MAGNIKTTAALSNPTGGDDEPTGLRSRILSYAQQRLGPEGAKVINAILETEGGLGGAVGDNGQSYGPFQFYKGGQLGNLAQQLGATEDRAGAWVLANAYAAAQWAIDGYLGNAIRAGQQKGISGAALATYAQDKGQVSITPERAGQNYNLLDSIAGLGATTAEAAGPEGGTTTMASTRKTAPPAVTVGRGDPNEIISTVGPTLHPTHNSGSANIPAYYSKTETHANGSITESKNVQGTPDWVGVTLDAADSIDKTQQTAWAEQVKKWDTADAAEVTRAKNQQAVYDAPTKYRKAADGSTEEWDPDIQDWVLSKDAPAVKSKTSTRQDAQGNIWNVDGNGDVIGTEPWSKAAPSSASKRGTRQDAQGNVWNVDENGDVIGTEPWSKATPPGYRTPAQQAQDSATLTGTNINNQQGQLALMKAQAQAKSDELWKQVSTGQMRPQDAVSNFDEFWKINVEAPQFKANLVATVTSQQKELASYRVGPNFEAHFDSTLKDQTAPGGGSGKTDFAPGDFTFKMEDPSKIAERMTLEVLQGISPLAAQRLAKLNGGGGSTTPPPAGSSFPAYSPSAEARAPAYVPQLSTVEPVKFPNYVPEPVRAAQGLMAGSMAGPASLPYAGPGGEYQDDPTLTFEQNMQRRYAQLSPYIPGG